MKIEKFKVLLYLKKSGMDKNGKAPIMGRITVNRTMAQFSCKLSCTPSLWNPRASRLEGKSKEAVETNKDIEQLLLSIQKAFGQLTEPFISDFHHYLLDEKGFSSGTITIYVSLFKKMCRIAFERGLCRNSLHRHRFHYESQCQGVGGWRQMAHL